MTDQLRQAAQQALVALECMIDDLMYKDHKRVIDISNVAITALRTALEQQAEPICPDCKAALLYECIGCSSNNYPPQQQAEPVQKLVAWGVFDGNLHDMFFTEEEAQEMVRLKGDGSTVAPLYTAPPQQQAEPVAWVCMNGEKHDIDFDQPEIDAIPVGTFLYTTPLQREWQGLTTEEVKHLYPYGRSVWGRETFEAIEKALKEKNT